MPRNGPPGLAQVGAAEVCRALNARCLGSGPHTAVLAHGFGCDQSVWEPFLPQLLSRHRVVLYDLAGSGPADPAFFDALRHGTLEGHVADMLAVLRAFSIDRCTVVGHSVSGMLAVLAAIEEPQTFPKLILVGSSARYLDDADYKGGFDQAALEPMFAAIGENFRTWATTMAPFVVGSALEEPASQTFLASLLRMRPDKTVALARTIFLSDYRDRLPECRVPAVILQTRRDPAVPIEAARYLNAHLEGSTFEILDAEGHIPQLTAPRAFAAALERHLPAEP